ncbi:MAG: 5-dehydro-4-deoxy-D-glucuronate isomerase [Melioribacter sp.]|uniref:5-dehydro-4-deoxy-D-glucuronate isomerase n=1 Tax=Rosettibacter primus TaxID=3111523 RepID=UPI00247C1140|nr:5-dehydro-4-deoxy-D-glucuronate isomerase [Melioribacter sp.]
MEVRYSPDPNGFKKMTTDELRKSFLIENLFQVNQIPMVYSDIDRSITGSAVPSGQSLKLTASKKEMAAEYFCERREIGVINIGSKGKIILDGKEYEMNNKDALYIGRGTKEVIFESDNESNPAQFYFVSYPAHKEYPSKHIKYDDAIHRHLGSVETSNKRTIHQYILPEILPTCQIAMGLTELEDGSVWNTMPAHTHQRRSEVYMYFNLKPDAFVVHLIGEPTETRHLIIRDRQAVLSTSWSLHSGCGTQSYSFIWAMGGENQVFDDMDWIAMTDLR